MSIIYDEDSGLLTLRTVSTVYQMKADAQGFFRHLYYGADPGAQDMSFEFRSYDCGFSGNPYELRRERTESHDLIHQEYPGFGVGDYRVHGVETVNADGSRCADFRYVSHEITAGRPAPEGLPFVRDSGGEAETLTVTLRDGVTGLTLLLRYCVFGNLDVITRSAEFVNGGDGAIALEKAASVCLDLPFGEWDLIHFYGRHCLERQVERHPIGHHITEIRSERGTSSHHHNPFVIVCERRAGEESGNCYGLMLMYSGGFRAELERSQAEDIRVVMGMGDAGFSWTLLPGECFQTPEVIMSYAEGLTALTHRFHRVIRRNVCGGAYRLAHRPVLINNWEATYFDLSEERIVALAREAAALGIELFVLDDGWFKGRADDNAGLGDWSVNREKLPDGLDPLIGQIRALGMRFGIWVEPEMVNEDSDLYRAHPDWALTVPGRAPTMGRNQLVLDLSRGDVCEYLYTCISSLLRAHDISYVKWDMNRSLSDVYSRALPPERQGETAHRYVLGLYGLLDRLTREFPGVLFEGCSGGGGRFDAGMLFYTPQIWCSDDTDPIERLLIQGGTAYGYPVSTMGAHVSASPNHQTGRSTPIETRGIVAMSGAFGYELDLTQITDEDRDAIRRQVKRYLADEAVLHGGLYYRLTDVTPGYPCTAWQMVSEDGSSAIVNLVIHSSQPNAAPPHVRLRGLIPEAEYLIEEDGRVFTGASLMRGGYTFPHAPGDYPACQLHLARREGDAP